MDSRNCRDDTGFSRRNQAGGHRGTEVEVCVREKEWDRGDEGLYGHYVVPPEDRRSGISRETTTGTVHRNPERRI